MYVWLTILSSFLKNENAWAFTHPAATCPPCHYSRPKVMKGCQDLVKLKASVCNYYQNFNIHTLRCHFLYIHDNAPGMITDTHDNNICGQKLNRNRTFFNPRSLLHTTLLNVHCCAELFISEWLLSYQRSLCYIFPAAETHSHVTNYINSSFPSQIPMPKAQISWEKK